MKPESSDRKSLATVDPEEFLTTQPKELRDMVAQYRQRGSQNSFVNSVMGQLKTRGWITPAQVTAVLAAWSQPKFSVDRSAAPVAKRICGRVTSVRNHGYGPMMLVVSVGEVDPGCRIYCRVPANLIGKIQQGTPLWLWTHCHQSENDPLFFVGVGESIVDLTVDKSVHDQSSLRPNFSAAFSAAVPAPWSVADTEEI